MRTKTTDGDVRASIISRLRCRCKIPVRLSPVWRVAAGRRELCRSERLLCAAAVAMQRILVDHARGRRAAKRGAGARTLAFTDEEPMPATDPDMLLDVADALARLAMEDASAADVARYRLFAGLSIEEAAEAMGVSRATAFREWAYARPGWRRLWLRSVEQRKDRCGQGDEPPGQVEATEEPETWSGHDGRVICLIGRQVRPT